MDARTNLTRSAALHAVVCLGMGFGAVACTPTSGTETLERGPDCPETRRVEPPLTRVRPEQRALEYWLARTEEYGPLDAELLDAAAIERHNRALRIPIDGDPVGQADLGTPVDPSRLETQVRERMAYLRDKVVAGDLVDEEGSALPEDLARRFTPPDSITLTPSWRRAEALKALRCGPLDAGLYTTPVDTDFDRNRCSTVRPGEVVELLTQWDDGLFLARTPYAIGWMDDDDLSQPLSADALGAPEGAAALAFTRRNVLTEAFSMLGAPYGWGGKNGGYDCSRFLLDLFGRFGIGLPRHSARQALGGTFSIDVSEVERGEKRLLLDAAARRGITLMQFPGHIMLYLGATEDGTPMAMHAFSEYLTRCDDGELETVNRVDRIAISDLELGEGSSRGDFLSRVTRITVIGETPGPALTADAVVRSAAPVAQPTGPCRDSQRHALFRSPLRPSVSQPLRVIATSTTNPGVVTLRLFGPNGEPLDASEVVLDGPPHSRFVQVADPAPGRWTAVLGDGDRIVACDRFVVAARPARAPARAPVAPAWQTTRQWTRSTENLYAAFVEQLFREPDDDDVTWSRLQEVIGDPERNLLYDYRTPGEDARLSLEPDCADLPYFLRAYFAWKLGLPFAYRSCTRGRRDAPPTCEPTLFSNIDPEEAATDVGAFRTFLRRMGGVVHSSSPRTRPSEELTDFYPVRLSRNALRPGTVFADPYGHVLVVARWKPQGVTDYGVLIGADAQPDATVGRRRFWRGSFLFTPNTDQVGAGFKAWRPLTVDAETSTVVAAANDELRGIGAQSLSERQYEGTSDDFYARVEEIVNPRPLDPVRMQRSLVDALAESVERRLSSVSNGEEFMQSRGFAPIDMPSGNALFLTSGPWEDYSTPSRDMRLLISIDAVTSFPAMVAAHPGRFGVREPERDAMVSAVEAALAEELAARTFEYIRSDGGAWELTLADLIARSAAMEMAYNPNDCPELRWGASEGSDEHSTCARRAPAEQQARMRKYRPWFEDRERPGAR